MHTAYCDQRCCCHSIMLSDLQTPTDKRKKEMYCLLRLLLVTRSLNHSPPDWLACRCEASKHPVLYASIQMTVSTWSAHLIERQFNCGKRSPNTINYLLNGGGNLGNVLDICNCYVIVVHPTWWPECEEIWKSKRKTWLLPSLLRHQLLR